MKLICPSWRLSEEGDRIVRTFNAKNFVAAVAFINKLADLAESEGHHPDLSVTSWNCVTVTLWTHSRELLTVTQTRSHKFAETGAIIP